MPTRPFGQTPPDKANELFDKLLATSENAAKTRERLFADLKEELELLANLQEQHLFPILRKHDMQELLQAATRDNDETSRLLSELEQMPKGSGEFLEKVSELRKAFQRHIRDDKKELLPAVLKVLSDEEVQAVVEQVEDEMADHEETRQAQTSRAEGIASTSNTMGVSDIVLTGLERSEATTRKMQELTLECLHMSQKRLQTNVDGLVKLAECRTPQDLAAAQLALLRDHLELTFRNTFRLTDLAVQLTERMTWRAGLTADKTAQHSRDFA